MARIMTVSEETAQGLQRELIEKAKAESGYLSGTRKILLADLQVAQLTRQLYDYLCLRPESPMTRIQREMVATVVYGIVGAKPCLSLHCEALRRLTGDDALGPEFSAAWPDYSIDASTRALLRYAKKLTESPDRIADSDVEGLREGGWDERGVYEATALIALFNFIGRLEAASGLPMDQIPAGASLPEAVPDNR